MWVFCLPRICRESYEILTGQSGGCGKDWANVKFSRTLIAVNLLLSWSDADILEFMLPISFLKEVRLQAKEYSTLDDPALKELALDLGFESRKTERLKPLLVRGFAMVLIAATRQLKMTHYDVQLAGGKAMAEGQVVEMRTGEGKTLTATLPLFVHALSGRGALLATANDYLAKRDAEEMQPIFHSLG